MEDPEADIDDVASSEDRQSDSPPAASLSEGQGEGKEEEPDSATKKETGEGKGEEGKEQKDEKKGDKEDETEAVQVTERGLFFGTGGKDTKKKEEEKEEVKQADHVHFQEKDNIVSIGDHLEDFGKLPSGGKSVNSGSSAGENMVRITNWFKNEKGGISGKVYDTGSGDNDYYIETEKISSGVAFEDGIVETVDGKTYFLGQPKVTVFDKPVPLTVDGVTSDLETKLKKNRIFSLYEKSDTLDSKLDDVKQWASTGTPGSNQTLRFGNFEFDDEETKEFTFVPMDFDFKGEDGFNDIMKELGIPRPDMTFLFKHNWGVVPNLDEKETEAYHRMRPQEFVDNTATWDYRRDLKYPNPTRQRHHKNKIETRVQNSLHALAEACNQSTAIFLLTEPHTGNIIGEMACHAASRHNVITLGLFVAQKFSYVYEDDDEYGKEQLTLKLNNLDYDEYLSADHVVPYGLYTSTHRWHHDTQTFSNNPEAVVSKGDKPSKSIRINTKRTRQETSFYETYRHQHVDNGLASKCSHCLVFEEAKDKDQFERIFLDRFPAGFLAVGSGIYVVEESVQCLKESRPLFVLKNSGAASNAIAELGYLGRRIYEGKFLAEVKDNYMDAISEAQHDYPRRKSRKNKLFKKNSHSEIPKPRLQTRAELLEVMEDYIEDHFPPKKGSAEAIEHFYPDRKAAHERDLGRELAIDDYVWDAAKVHAETFSSDAPNFNPDTMDIFDVGIFMDLKDLQNRITKVMSSSYDHRPELGGAEKDRIVLIRATRIQQALSVAKLRYRILANVHQLMLRSVIFATMLLTVVQSELIEEGSELNEIFKIVNTILPLVGSLLTTIEYYYRPSSVFAALLLAEKRIESEKYRFRTRTGVYHIKRSRGTDENGVNIRIRAQFADNCKNFYDDCVKSDFSSGSLFTKYSSRKTQAEIFGLSNEPLKTTESPELTADAGNDDSSIASMDRSPEAFERSLQVGNWSKGQTHGITPGLWTGSEADVGQGGDLEASTGVDATEVLTADVLSADEYVELRLKPKLVEFYREVPGHAALQFYFRLIVISLTATSAAFASLGLEGWVPVILAAAASFEFGIQYFQLDTRVPNLNNCAGEITKTFLWWTGLTLIQTRLPSYRDELVDRTEDAIVAQYESFAGATLSAAKKRNEDSAAKAKNDATSPDGENSGEGEDNTTPEKKKGQ